MSRPMPRLFVIRHGETEWSQNGRHTGYTDIPLTEKGEEGVKVIAERLVGPGLPLNPQKIACAFVSPRQRAQKTFDLLFGKCGYTPPKNSTEEVREWDYGDYEGITSPDIKELNPGWSLWNDGAPGGESVQDMEERVDGVIQMIRKLHKEYIAGACDTRDVLIVAHGHFNRVLISRWLSFPLSGGTSFNVEPASVAVLGYNHNSIEEPVLNALNLYATIL